jgi:hypothetical protein
VLAHDEHGESVAGCTFGLASIRPLTAIGRLPPLGPGALLGANGDDLEAALPDATLDINSARWQ